jgi:tRNA threonylcarbamoyladenosine biosynthesis protein TsaB
VRIAVGVAQGLAFGANLGTVGISTLAAVAQQIALASDRVLVCMDARMQEVYWARFRRDPSSGLIESVGPEQLSAPDAIGVDPPSIDVIAGTALPAYPQLAERFATARHVVALPRSHDILLLAEREFVAGHSQSAAQAQPVYLRDQVTFVKPV